MNLAETIRSIKGSQARMGWVLREFNDTVTFSYRTEAGQARLHDLLRQINGMVTTRAALRTRVARTLGEHPEVVAALAERTAARIEQRLMDSLDPALQDGQPGAVLDLLARRREQAPQRLYEADLHLERLSARIHLTPVPRDRRRERP